VAFSHDGQLLASGSIDNVLRVWNATPLPRQSPWLQPPMQ
jgi:WD40 repeat protein